MREKNEKRRVCYKREMGRNHLEKGKNNKKEKRTGMGLSSRHK
jgi:hypothetical protein